MAEPEMVDAMGQTLAIGDRVALALGPAEIVVGTITDFVGRDSQKPFYWGNAYNGTPFPHLKVRVECRGQQWRSEIFEAGKQKELVYSGPRRFIRLEKMDVAAFLSDLRATEEALREPV